MRGEEVKVDPMIAGGEPSPQKGSYFSRFLPKLPSLRSSPKPNANSKKGESPRQPVDNLVRVMETHQVHRYQVKDTELKNAVGPTPEHIAVSTDAPSVLHDDGDLGRLRHRFDDDMFGGEHSAILDLLR